MTEAPERIWAGNWLADVGETVTWDMGEWRNEPWPTVDVVEYVRADRIEELEAVVGRQHKRAETLAEGWRIADDARIELEAKLAKAVEDAFFAGFAEGSDGGWVEGDPTPAFKKYLAELTGGKDE